MKIKKHKHFSNTRFKIFKEKLKEQSITFFNKKKFKSIIHHIGSSNINMIFLLSLLEAFSSVAHFIFFPVAIFATLFETLFVIKNEGKETLKRSKTIMSIFTTLGIVVGCVFALIGIAAFTSASSYVLSITLGLKSCYDLVKASYNWVQYFKCRSLDAHKAQYLRHEAIKHTMNFICFALTASALAAMGFTDHSTFAAIGITSGVIGTSYAIYSGYKAYKDNKHETAQNIELHEDELNKFSFDKTTNSYIHEFIHSQKPIPQATLDSMTNKVEHQLEIQLGNLDLSENEEINLETSTLNFS